MRAPTPDAMDRKAATRAYKEMEHPMGVFRVHNTVTDRSFVGTSVNLPAMLNRQQAQLKFGGHVNRELQQDWNALGPDAFRFEVLDTLDPPDDRLYDPKADLQTLEALWLERLPGGSNAR